MERASEALEGVIVAHATITPSKASEALSMASEALSKAPVITHAAITPSIPSITSVSSHSKVGIGGVDVIFLLFPQDRIARKRVQTPSHGHVVVHEVVAYVIWSHPIAW